MKILISINIFIQKLSNNIENEELILFNNKLVAGSLSMTSVKIMYDDFVGKWYIWTVILEFRWQKNIFNK